VRYLAGECGLRQFLDIGTGLPVADNTHQVAQAVAPDARIVYADNDPIVLLHARALMTSTPQGATTSKRTFAIPQPSSRPPRGPWTSVRRWR